MNIKFDFEEKLSSNQLKQMFEGETGIILNKMKSFVEQRLSILKDEIDSQKDGIIILESKQPFNFYGFGFKESTVKKILESINQQDHEYLMNEIWSELYPGTIPPTS